MTTETFIKYDKQFLPGYTGHVPESKQIFGVTAGDANKLINGEKTKPSNYNIDVCQSKPQYQQRDYFDSKHQPVHER